MKKLLFVCTGNICRSLTAEAIFRHKVIAHGFENHFIIDSAGTHGYHIGHPPDHRSIQVAKNRGVDMAGLAARKLGRDDYKEFDLLLAMDDGHFHDMMEAKPAGSRAEVVLFLDYHPECQGGSVADPYYGDISGFEEAFDLIDQAAEHLLKSFGIKKMSA